MDLQQRLTGLAMTGATWLAWVLAGLAVGGIAVALDRAISLIRGSEKVRQLQRRLGCALRLGRLRLVRRLTVRALYLPVRCPVDCRP
jgi:hypothetical protein